MGRGLSFPAACGALGFRPNAVYKYRNIDPELEAAVQIGHARRALFFERLLIAFANADPGTAMAAHVIVQLNVSFDAYWSPAGWDANGLRLSRKADAPPRAVIRKHKGQSIQTPASVPNLDVQAAIDELVRVPAGAVLDPELSNPVAAAPADPQPRAEQSEGLARSLPDAVGSPQAAPGGLPTGEASRPPTTAAIEPGPIRVSSRPVLVPEASKPRPPLSARQRARRAAAERLKRAA